MILVMMVSVTAMMMVIMTMALMTMMMMMAKGGHGRRWEATGYYRRLVSPGGRVHTALQIIEKPTITTKKFPNQYANFCYWPPAVVVDSSGSPTEAPRRQGTKAPRHHLSA